MWKRAPDTYGEGQFHPNNLHWAPRVSWKLGALVDILHRLLTKGFLNGVLPMSQL